MWAAYRDDRAEAATAEDEKQTDLMRLADELALAVRAQWEAEATLRHLNDPLLPVQWVAADARLAEDWTSIVALAASGAGWPVPPPEGEWATEATSYRG
jgi:hypothetical protein